jgi:hypothetical protein
MTFAFLPEGAQRIELGFQLPVKKLRSWTEWTENRSYSCSEYRCKYLNG